MSSDKPVKFCTRDVFCNGMDSMLNPETNAHMKGLTTILVAKLETGESRIIGVAYKKSASDKGLMLNNCPWCAAPILWVSETDDEQRSQNTAVDRYRETLEAVRRTGSLQVAHNAVDEVFAEVANHGR